MRRSKPTTDVMQVVAVTTIAIMIGTIPHMAVGQAPRLESLARRVLVAGFAAVLFRPLYIHGYLDADLARWLAAARLHAGDRASVRCRGRAARRLGTVGP